MLYYFVDVQPYTSSIRRLLEVKAVEVIEVPQLASLVSE